MGKLALIGAVLAFHGGHVAHQHRYFWLGADRCTVQGVPYTRGKLGPNSPAGPPVVFKTVCKYVPPHWANRPQPAFKI